MSTEQGLRFSSEPWYTDPSRSKPLPGFPENQPLSNFSIFSKLKNSITFALRQSQFRWPAGLGRYTRVGCRALARLDICNLFLECPAFDRPCISRHLSHNLRTVRGRGLRANVQGRSCSSLSGANFYSWQTDQSVIIQFYFYFFQSFF